MASKGSDGGDRIFASSYAETGENLISKRRMREKKGKKEKRTRERERERERERRSILPAE